MLCVVLLGLLIFCFCDCMVVWLYGCTCMIVADLVFSFSLSKVVLVVQGTTVMESGGPMTKTC